MNGLHLSADLRGCPEPLALMTEPEALRTLCRASVAVAGLTPVGELFHAFPAPGGVTGVVLLAQSHLAVHTWPELGAVTLDVHVCNQDGDHGQAAQRLLDALVAAFAPREVLRHRTVRGALGAPMPAQALPCTAAAAARPAASPRVKASSKIE